MSLERNLLSSTLTPRPRAKSRTLRCAIVMVLIATIVASAASAVAVIASRRADQSQARAALAEQLLVDAADRRHSHEEQAVTAFLQLQKVITPEQLARAIVNVTRDRREQRLLAAVAVVESRGNAKAIGQRGERGAYQVRPELHGPVPADLDGQTEQALTILRHNTDRFGVRAGVKSYNGSGPGAERYAATVLAYAGEMQ
ncbi:MAG: hypothetical protein Q7U44_00455 [Desulfuromonadales bacterium]|nr:hypothetical protein [Desulfuromonadales bacterium]